MFIKKKTNLCSMELKRKMWTSSPCLLIQEVNQVVVMQRWTEHCHCPHGAQFLPEKEEQVKGDTGLRWERGKRSLWEVRVPWKPERWVRALQGMSRPKSDHEKAEMGDRGCDMCVCVVCRCTGNRKQPGEGLGGWYLRWACGRKSSLCIFKLLASGLPGLFSGKSILFRDAVWQILTNTPSRVDQVIEHLRHHPKFPCAPLGSTSFPSCQPLASTGLLSVTLTLPFPHYHNGIIQCIAFHAA